MEVLAIIQARGGSKRLPNKNILPLNGKPLIAWTVEAAKNATHVNRVVISTDSTEIASAAKDAGAEVPFMRPVEFAGDNAKSVGLLKHALDFLKEKEGYVPDIIVQLKPTNPLRTSEHIDDCVSLFNPDKFDSLITVRPVSEHPYKMWNVQEEGEVVPFIPVSFHGIEEPSKSPKQLLPQAYIQNSYVHVIKPDTILKMGSSIGKKVQGFVMDEDDSVNIDTKFDFKIAELMMQENED